MLTLLLGPDEFGKTEYIKQLAQEAKADVAVFDPENVPMVENLIQGDLFSKPKVFVLKNLVKTFGQPQTVDRLISAENQIIIEEEKLDKRLADNKTLVANKNIAVKNFPLPHGKELNSWIANRVQVYKAKISPDAIERLAISLGRDDTQEIKVGGKLIAVEEIYNLWQADMEIQKLAAYARSREITSEDVKLLANENREVDVFSLTNAIADNQKQKAMDLMDAFLKQQTGSDEKGAVIQLNALLSEQFRNVAIVQDFSTYQISEAEILEKTGWKSGRLFIIKKIASRFSPEKVLNFLHKLAALDEELKTSSMPSKVLLDLIVSQLLT